MMHEQRWFPRYAVRKDVKAVLTIDGEEAREATPTDISCGGAYLQVSTPNTDSGKLVLSVREPFRDEPFFVTRDCAILPKRSGASGGCAVRFRQALSGEALAKFAADSSTVGSLGLAKADYAGVHQEIRLIQSCRSQLFLGTLAAITAWLAAAIGLVVTNKLVNIGVWTIIGAGVPYLLLTVAILATVEKSRALNTRRGFLAALTEYLRHDTPPPNYLGWPHLRITKSECRARMAAGLCPDRNTYCWESERADHVRLTKKKHLVSNVMDSFTALSTAVFALLYVSTFAIVVLASWQALYGKPGLALIVALCEGAAAIGIGFFLHHQLKTGRKGKHSIEAQLLVWRAVLRHCRPLGLE